MKFDRETHDYILVTVVCGGSLLLAIWLMGQGL